MKLIKTILGAAVLLAVVLLPSLLEAAPSSYIPPKDMVRTRWVMGKGADGDIQGIEANRVETDTILANGDTLRFIRLGGQVTLKVYLGSGGPRLIGAIITGANLGPSAKDSVKAWTTGSNNSDGLDSSGTPQTKHGPLSVANTFEAETLSLTGMKTGYKIFAMASTQEGVVFLGTDGSKVDTVRAYRKGKIHGEDLEPGTLSPSALRMQDFGRWDTNGTDDLTQTAQAGGDLSGMLVSPTVCGLRGISIIAMPPAEGQVLEFHDEGPMQPKYWRPATFNPTLSGDVNGSMQFTTVSRLYNRNLAATAPGYGMVYTWSHVPDGKGNYMDAWSPDSVRAGNLAYGSVGATAIASGAVGHTALGSGVVGLGNLDTIGTLSKLDLDRTDDLIQSTNFGGDLTGKYNDLRLAKIKGWPIADSTPVEGGLLYWHKDSLRYGKGDSSSISTKGLTGGNLADSTINGQQIAGGAIGEVHLAGGAVTNGKLADGAVTGGKIADSTITATNLAPPIRDFWADVDSTTWPDDSTATIWKDGKRATLSFTTP